MVQTIETGVRVQISAHCAETKGNGASQAGSHNIHVVLIKLP